MWLQEEANHTHLNSTSQTMLLNNTRRAIKMTHSFGKNKATLKATEEVVLREALTSA